MTYRTLSLLSIALLLIVGCTSSPDADQSNDTSAEDDSPTGVYEQADWDYEGDTGPTQWAELSPTYAACAGDRQSPIDLADATTADGPALAQAYAPTAAEVVDTGHGLQINTGGGTLSVDGVTYDLIQFHVHTPSEHTVGGSDYPAEIHFVHQAGDSLAVVGVFVDEGTANEGLETWLQSIERNESSIEYDVNALFPDQRSYYTYSGSLTTPPCSEIVHWVVLDTPITASPDQLDAFRDRHDDNARPVQPLGDRSLQYISAE
jgi:carbonic anhydrase